MFFSIFQCKTGYSLYILRASVYVGMPVGAPIYVYVYNKVMRILLLTNAALTVKILLI